MRVGVEVGGTFTDLVAIDNGKVVIAKVPSTPAEPDRGALDAINAAALPYDQITDLVHGSTVATNAILERKGARVAFLVTKGFRDILFLQRHNRTRIYDLFYKKPEPVVRRRDILEIPERIGPKGEVIRALDDDALSAAIDEFFAGETFSAVAVCFLNGYANPEHERRVAKVLAGKFPSLSVTCSADVTREFREYERASTTTLAAYVQPVIDGYLKRLESNLTNQSFAGRFSIMQSNGGRIPAEAMGRNAITSLFSGPAAGVIGALRQAEQSGYRNIITLDMGGTSTDVCLIEDGKPALSSETEVDGLPIRTPVLDIATVGAGGGSICWIDDGQMPRVGPESAGADPGPACYGRGGDRPTVTDAHMIRGTIRASAFLGGRMDVDCEASREVFADFAQQFDQSLEQAADSAIRIADSNIVRAIQLVSTERGRDPRDYALVPFGGAGPLHAVRVAEELGIDTIVVPPNAGVLSAYGLLTSDYVRYETRTNKVPVDDDAPGKLKKIFANMADVAEQGFRDLNIDTPLEFSYALEMRFVGQAFEVAVDLSNEDLAELDKKLLMKRFNDAHHRVFSFGDAGLSQAEIVSFRLGASAPQPQIPPLTFAGGEDGDANEAAVFDQGKWLDHRLLTRSGFKVDSVIDGPLLIEDENATVFVPLGWGACRDSFDNIVIEKGRA
jgi:N-methylhydantoinase A